MTDIRGQVTGQTQLIDSEFLAIGINGVISSVIELGSRFEQTQNFSALVSEQSFRTGRNEVDVFFVTENALTIELQRLQKDSQNRYSLSAEVDENGNDSTEILVLPNGQQIPIDSRNVVGYVRSDIVQDNTVVTISGWSLDVANADIADVLIFVNGELRASVTPDIRRNDVENVRPEAVGLTPGFRAGLPFSDTAALGQEEVRVFGISQDSATELIPTENWVFSN